MKKHKVKHSPINKGTKYDHWKWVGEEGMLAGIRPSFPSTKEGTSWSPQCHMSPTVLSAVI